MDIKPEGVAKGSDVREQPIQTTVGETGKFDNTGIPRGPPNSSADTNDDGDTYKKGGITEGWGQWRLSGSSMPTS